MKRHTRLLCIWAWILPQFWPTLLAQDCNSSKIVARVNGRSITQSEFTATIANRLLKIRTDEYNQKHALLERFVNDLVLKEEARIRDISVEELLAAEVDAKVNTPEAAKVRALYSSEKRAYADLPEDMALGVIAKRIQKQERSERQAQYCKSLWSKYNVATMLQAPRAMLLPSAGPAMGPASAAVTIVEFSDYECPFCADAAETVRRLRRLYPSEIRVVFKKFPSLSHRNAVKAAEAALCADRQGRFWDLHDKLFSNQRHLTEQDVIGYSKDLGIDNEKLLACLATGVMNQVWQEDQSIGLGMGVTGTPTFFVNGRMISGNVPFERFLMVVEQELHVSGAEVVSH